MAQNNFENWVASLNRRGMARPNMFEAEIFFPASLNGDARTLSTKIKSITMPGKNIDTSTNDTIYGPTHELARGLTYADEINITFWLSTDLHEKKELDKWQDYIYNPRTYELNFYDDYIGTIAIYQLDSGSHERVSGVQLRECFPKTVSPIDYENDTVSTIQTLQVGFAFKEWEQISGLGLPENPKPPVVGHISEQDAMIYEPQQQPSEDMSYIPNRYMKTEDRGELPDMTVDTIDE